VGLRFRSSGVVLPIVPGEEVRWVDLELFDIFEHPGQIIEGIDPRQLTGVDDAHKQVSHIGAVSGLEKKGVFSMQYRVLQSSFTDIMPTAGLCRIANFIRFNWPKIRGIPYSHSSINRHNQRLSRNVSNGSSGRYRSGMRPLAVAWARACSLIPISACK
jgi:hypothetical protein